MTVAFRLALATIAAAGSALAFAAVAQPAAPAAPAPAAPDAATLAKGRELFTNYACGGCHTLADAGAASPVGPSLDNNPTLTRDLLIDRIANGQGPMPAFGGQMTAEEIAAVADYVTAVATK